jgi:hypothetical protein
VRRFGVSTFEHSQSKSIHDDINLDRVPAAGVVLGNVHLSKNLDLSVFHFLKEHHSFINLEGVEVELILVSKDGPGHAFFSFEHHLELEVDIPQIFVSDD